MKKYIISMVCSVCVAIAPMSALSVSAAEETMYFTEKGQEAIINAAGLITYAHLYISKEGTTLYITAETVSNSTMKSIGFKDIVVEYSTNNSDWDTYTNIGDVLNSSTNSCYMDDYSVPITNGYYYRVTLTHYAKETGWFGSSQSVSNISNVVS